MQVADPPSFMAATRVSRETLDRLALYESCLRKWQKSINLISPGTLDALWNRHFFDSAQILDLLPRTDVRIVDLGSGGGFPGAVLAVLLAGKGAEIHLIDSDRRKATFLRDVLRQCGAPATVHAARIEEIPPESFGPVDVVTARACAPLPDLLGLAAPFFQSATIGLFLKGQQVGDELTASRKWWTFKTEKIPSRSDPAGTILKVEGLSRGHDG